MDETYPVEAYPNASQEFNFQNYFRKYSRLLKETWYINQGVLERLNNDEEKIASQLGIEMREYHRLEERCRLVRDYTFCPITVDFNNNFFNCQHCSIAM
jgi:hypothetical protein